jgi:membrane-bound lytic murein transglycosylase D
VKSGDTAGGIAIKHGVTLKQLVAANSLDRNAAIYIGQRLRIPDAKKNSRAHLHVKYLPVEEKKQYSNKGPHQQTQNENKKESKVIALVANKKNKPDTKRKITVKKGGKKEKITVQPEESLSLYAYWLKLSEQKLREVNNLKQLSQIHPGQELTVLYDHVSAAEFAEKRAEFLHENEMDFFAAYKVIEFKPYLVVNGDTLWDLCNKEFNIPLWLLKKYNRELNFTALHKGQELKVPVVQAL